MRADGHDALYGMVGARIAQARAKTTFSQRALADKVGVTRVSIVNIEQGKQRPPLHLLWRIAGVLGVEPVSLVPTQQELTAQAAPIELSAKIIATIERAAENDPGTKRLLTAFLQRAATQIEGTDG